jgi:hypothetical protein
MTSGPNLQRGNFNQLGRLITRDGVINHEKRVLIENASYEVENLWKT